MNIKQGFNYVAVAGLALVLVLVIAFVSAVWPYAAGVLLVPVILITAFAIGATE